MRYKDFFVCNIKGLNVLFKALPLQMTLYCILQLVHGVSWVFQVIFLQKFFDNISKFSVGMISWFDIILSLFFTGIFFFLAQLMNGIANCYGQLLNKRAGKEMNLLLFGKIKELPTENFENVNELERINKAIKGKDGLFWVCVTLLDILFFYCTYFIAMSWYLFSLVPLLGISVIIIFIPNVCAKFIHTVAFRNLESQIAPLRRKREYYEKCLTSIEYYKETRLLGASKFFLKLYKEVILKMNRLNLIAQVRKEIVNFIIHILTVMAYGIIIYLLFYYVMRGQVSLGAFVAVLASLRRFYGFMEEVVSERFGWAAENIAPVENFIAFIKNNKSVKWEELPEKFNIRLCNVSFSYPAVPGDTPKKVLENINLEIPYGQTIALVGENGSGKTTLCNIIAGIYFPKQGEVFLDNIKTGINRIKGISSVFQNFCHYKMTVKENIIISESDREVKEDEILLLCKKLGIYISESDGLEEMLGREFGGMELSGGQWQRIAIARGLYRKSHLLVLDEPTAAIDPLEENILYQYFKDICKNYTAILVTHRLASAQIADRILVMKNGRIVQDGTHEQLINQKGEYKKLYEMQKELYM